MNIIINESEIFYSNRKLYLEIFSKAKSCIHTYMKNRVIIINYCSLIYINK